MGASSGGHVDVVDLGDDVYSLDTRMAGYAGITSGYLIRSDAPCLIETGTANSADQVTACLASLGVEASDLATVIVTHIHLDHAGGVGDIAERFPNAQVVVHSAGARHLADPAKLVASARRVFGPDMDRLFGELKPTPVERIRALEAGRIDLGGQRYLEVFSAPGHASHHVGIVDSSTGDLYTGDAAGLYIPETADVRPSTPPPDFDLELAIESIEHMRARRPGRLLFSHFGPVADVDSILDRSIEELRVWVEIVRGARDAGLDLDHAVAMVLDRSQERYPRLHNDADVAAKFEELSSAAANVAGISRYLDRVDGPGSTSGDAASAQPQHP